MEFFSQLEQIIACGDPHQKIEHCNDFYQNFQNYRFEHAQKSISFQKPSYSAFCTIVDPQKVPRRRLSSKEGKAIFLHALAHIEYSAIDLALDAAYRFKHMPKEFYKDWLEVAVDECRHFLMLQGLLQELGYRYGDFAVHQGLFDAARATPTLIDRMAVVPRYLEANGLDANPRMIAKLQKNSDPLSLRIAKVLQTILIEEVDHVAKGDRWFRWACEQEGVADMKQRYFQAVERVYPKSRGSKKWLNVAMRKQAGFSCEEIQMLSKDNIDC